jgi:hypothetical protein
MDINELPVLIRASKKNKKYGVYNKEGKETIPFKYQDIGPFCDNIAYAQKDKNGLYGFIDSKGKEIVPFMYNNAWSFQNGIGIVSKGSYRNISYTAIDKEGIKITDLGKVMYIFGNTSMICVLENGLAILKNRDGKVIMDKPNYTYSNGLSSRTNLKNLDNALGTNILVMDTNTKKYGVINQKGEVVISISYSHIKLDKNDSYFIVKKEPEGKWGIITNKEEMVCDFIIDEIHHIKGSYKNYFTANNECLVTISGKKYFVDSNGNQLENINKIEHNHVTLFKSPNSLTINAQNTNLNTYTGYTSLTVSLDKYGKSASGEYIVGFPVKEIDYSKTYCSLKDNKGNTLIKTAFQSFLSFSYDHIKLELDNHIFYVDIMGQLVTK